MTSSKVGGARPLPCCGRTRRTSTCAFQATWNRTASRSIPPPPTAPPSVGAARSRAPCGWKGTVTHAHPECGNGVTWSLELRRGAKRQRLAAGVAQGGNPVAVGPIEKLSVRPGDTVSLLIGPRDGNHGCDLTALDLAITASGGRTWDLADDVSSDVLAGNPHADRLGNEAVWHFYAEAEKDGVPSGPAVPVGSLLAKWQAAEGSDEQRSLAAAVQQFLTGRRRRRKTAPTACSMGS